MLHCLESKKIDPSYSSCEFEVELDDGTVVKQSSLERFKERLLVFNQQFIEDNIDWKMQGTKVIVTISEEKIEERTKFFEIKDKQLPIARQLLDNKRNTYNSSEKERDEFLSAVAKSVKQSFQLIDTKDSRYMNYDRTKIRAFIAEKSDDLKKQESIISKSELEELTTKIRPVQRPEITWTLPELTTDYSEGIARIASLLTTSVVSETIQKLQEQPELNVWVQQGLTLHKAINTDTCEFCEQPLPPDRIRKLEAHFSKQYADLLDRLNKAKGWLSTVYFELQVPDGNELYEEFQEEFKKTVLTTNERQEKFNGTLKEIAELIDKKIANPFSAAFELEFQLDELLVEIGNLRNQILSIINAHNTKTRNFEGELKKYKEMLELHYVADAIKDKGYFDLISRILNEKRALDAQEQKVYQLTEEQKMLEASLANVAKGAENFNKDLHSFLGRIDLSLSYDSREKAYRIVRGNPSTPAANLSEGEKTAIAFVFFINKISENGNKVENSIVVVDDPISSFDANHLFHSLTFMKQKCGDAKQLFVLTHNFQYFKLVRDWLLAKNKNGNVKSCIYAIEVDKFVRKAFIKNAHESMIRFGSEYQYLFKKLLEFKEEQQLNIESAYQVANYSRKLLEGFFKFKHPKERNDFYQLMEAGCKAGKVDQHEMERVYRFINRYSHNDAIEFHDSSVDNLIGEGENITQQVLNIIQKCDETHFVELEEICHN